MAQLCSPAMASYSNWPNGFGQIIELNTFFEGYVGMPSWLLIVRDIDHNQNIPYVYDFYQGRNGWIAFTYGHNYEVLASQMRFDPYGEVINNFCGLENFKKIRGESIRVVLTGDLTPDTRTFKCEVQKFPDAPFAVIR